MKPKEKAISDSIDVKKVAEIGSLGVLENGLLMLTWYNVLNRYIGSGVTTGVDTLIQTNTCQSFISELYERFNKDIC